MVYTSEKLEWRTKTPVDMLGFIKILAVSKGKNIWKVHAEVCAPKGSPLLTLPLGSTLGL